MGPAGFLVALGALFGLTGREIDSYERAAAKEIALGLRGENVRVHVQAEPSLGGAFGHMKRVTISASDFSVVGVPFHVEPWRSTYAHCSELRFDLRDFRLRGLRVERLTATIPACRYDLGLARSERRFRLSKSGTGRGTVRVLESDLADFVMKKFREVSGLKVTLGRNVIWAEGHIEAVLFDTDFALISGLTAIDGRQIALNDSKVYFDWKRIEDPHALTNFVNPVVDLDKDLGLEGAMAVDTVKIGEGWIDFSGTVTVPVATDDTSKEPKTLLGRLSNESSSPLLWSAVRK